MKRRSTEGIHVLHTCFRAVSSGEARNYQMITDESRRVNCDRAIALVPAWRYPDEHEVDVDVRYARNPGYLVLPGSVSMKDFAKSPAVKKSGKSVTYPCCLTHKRICSIANVGPGEAGSGSGNGGGSKALEGGVGGGGGGGGGGAGDSLVHILVWEEHKMRYRSSGQCTDKLPPDLDEVVEQVGHGVKAVGPGS